MNKKVRKIEKMNRPNSWNMHVPACTKKGIDMPYRNK